MLMRILMYPVFHMWLKSEIKHNYTMRYIAAMNRNYGVNVCDKDGNYWPDEMFWADEFCARYGYYVDWEIDHVLIKRCETLWI